MTYTKPNDVTYTEMCQWIDDNVYTEKYDEVKLYEYLYHIVHMLAVKGCMFQSWRDYDDFSLMGATRLFLRLQNKKQFEVTGKQKLMPKIKSILNYTKRIMGPMRADYDRQSGHKSVDTQVDNYTVLSTVEFQQQLRETVECVTSVDFNCYMQDIPKTIKAFLKRIPHSNNGPEWFNIYLSCLLSILNSITLPNKSLDVLRNTAPHQIKMQVVERMYDSNREDAIILYHLPLDMKDYITVLVNRVRSLMVRDMMSILNVYIPTSVGMGNLMSSAIEDDFA